MLAWNNVELLVEVKLAKKYVPKFGVDGPKVGPKLVFFVIFSSLVH